MCCTTEHCSFSCKYYSITSFYDFKYKVVVFFFFFNFSYLEEDDGPNRLPLRKLCFFHQLIIYSHKMKRLRLIDKLYLNLKTTHLLCPLILYI